MCVYTRTEVKSITKGQIIKAFRIIFYTVQRALGSSPAINHWQDV